MGGGEVRGGEMPDEGEVCVMGGMGHVEDNDDD